LGFQDGSKFTQLHLLMYWNFSTDVGKTECAMSHMFAPLHLAPFVWWDWPLVKIREKNQWKIKKNVKPTSWPEHVALINM